MIKDATGVSGGTPGGCQGRTGFPWTCGPFRAPWSCIRQVFLGACVLLLPAESSARTWRVSVDGTGDAPTIQAAIDSAASGDLVAVEGGTYHEVVNFSGKDITVRGAGRSQTTIDASGLDSPCVRFLSRESNLAILESMTITGGSGQKYGNARIGGGIMVDEAEPTLRDLRIVNNTAVGTTGSYGGGVYVLGRSGTAPVRPVIEDCEIADNVARAVGGGIGFGGWAAPIIRNCEIHDNRAELGDGGGVSGTTGSGGSRLESNLMVNNSAGDHGGAVVLTGTPSFPTTRMTVENNLIARNSAYGRDSQDVTGGGMLLGYLSAEVRHNTIVGNLARGGSGIVAGGIGLVYGGEYLVEFNIIADTKEGYAIVCEDDVRATIRNNLSWENAGIGRFACEDWVHSSGNVEADPLFCEPDMGNFSVQESSPALRRFPTYAGYKGTPGCMGKVVFSTWGAIKARYWGGEAEDQR